MDAAQSAINIVAPTLALIFNNCIDWDEFSDLMKNSNINVELLWHICKE